MHEGCCLSCVYPLVGGGREMLGIGAGPSAIRGCHPLYAEVDVQNQRAYGYALGQVVCTPRYRAESGRSLLMFMYHVE